MPSRYGALSYTWAGRFTLDFVRQTTDDPNEATDVATGERYRRAYDSLDASVDLGARYQDATLLGTAARRARLHRRHVLQGARLRRRFRTPREPFLIHAQRLSRHPYFFSVDVTRGVREIHAPDRVVGTGGGVVVVGFLVDGRVRGPGDRSLAEDAARGMAGGGIQTHRFELVPTPVQSPRILHTPLGPQARPRTDLLDSPPDSAARFDAEISESCVARLADQVAEHIRRESIGTLHAIGLDLPGRVARLVSERTGTPYCVTPRATDLHPEVASAHVREVLRGARHLVLFDEALRPAVEAAFPIRAGDPPLRLRILRRGIDLELFMPLPRQERGSAAVGLTARPELAARLADIDWARACVVLCVQHPGETEGFGEFLFAVPELLRQQPLLQVLVLPTGPMPAAIDRLRAALAAGKPENLQGVLQESERYQPLLDHLEQLHAEKRTESWWQHAARLEPERRLRFLGPVSRQEFARLVALADLLVLPGTRPRPFSHLPYEALAAGVPSVASVHSGMGPVAQLLADNISPEIAALCLLRDDAPAVSELEQKLGRFVRLRPELGERLRALAVRKFDIRQTATDLRRLYAEPARMTAARP